MDFLKNHYEKIILGVLLIAIVVGFIKALSQMEQIDQGGNNSRPFAGGSKKIEMAKAVKIDYNTVDKIKIDKKTFSIGTHVYCKKPGCNYIFSETEPKCPKCGDMRGTTINNIVKKNKDTDNDGIPDDVEKRLGLDPTDPKDALKDKDKDGFANIFEIKKGTDISEKEDHPPLYYHLRYRRSKDKTLSFRFKGIIDNGAKADWLLQIQVKGETKLMKIGQSVDGYKIEDAEIIETLVNGVAVDQTNITLVDKNGAKFQARKDKKITPPNSKVYQFRDNLNDKSIEVRPGETITIKSKSGEEVEYKFLSYNSTKKGPEVDVDEEKPFVVGKKTLYDSEMKEIEDKAKSSTDPEGLDDLKDPNKRRPDTDGLELK